MKELIQRHYEATCKRGLIGPYTTTHDFIEKMKEEFNEVLSEYDEETGIVDGDMAQECMDLVGVIFNMLIEKGFDIEAEFEHNVYHQESRI
jgi:hypothetical protein